MIIVSVSYVIHGFLYNSYNIDKTLIVFIICLLKVIDAMEDLIKLIVPYHNRYLPIYIY